MGRIRILSTDIDNLSISDFLASFEKLLTTHGSHQIATVNAEFLATTQRDAEFRSMLRKTALNLADGIGVLWAAKFFSIKVYRIPGLVWAQTIFQIISIGFLILFYPRYIRTVIAEKLSGSELIWNIAEELSRMGKTLFLLGGFGDTPRKVSDKLLEKYPKLKIVGYYTGGPDDPDSVRRVALAHPDCLLVAYGQIVQEKWISSNLQNLRVKVAIGVGGTFDYMAGIRPPAPKFLRYMGLEWAWRLFTQPHRLRRIVEAVIIFPSFCARYKVQLTKPYRQNIVACIVNDDGKVLTCKRHFTDAAHPLHAEPVWQLPQGGLEAGESYEQGMTREILEETGILNAKIKGVLPRVFRYDFPPEIVYTANGGKFRGQEQSIVYLRVPNEARVVLDNREFVDYRWIDKRDLLSTIHPVRHGLIKIVQDNFDTYITSKK